MELLSTGTFVLLNVLGFGLFSFSVISKIEFAKYLLILPMMIFFVIAFYMVAEYEVGDQITEITTDGTTTWNSTKNHIVIADFDTNWLNWLYLGLGGLCLVLIMYSWRMK